jgi:(R,R)-butanediol dehydrogenase/meso-butanediol dehydrogenase/diacetyl reductase
MRAAQYYGKEDVRIEQIPEPATPAGAVKVRVAANGLCGTDLHLFYGGAHPAMTLPVVLGHEFGGEVVEFGDGVDDLHLGDQVAVEPLIPCGKCDLCGAGDYNLCGQMRVHGFAGAQGGLAEFCVAARPNSHRLPPGLTGVQGALVEPLAVAHHAVRQAPPGKSAAVFGAGPIGIGIFLTLRALGSGPIVVVEPSERRRAAIAALGAEQVLDPGAGDVVAAIRDLVPGGVGAAFEAAGNSSALASAISATAPKGTVVVVATYEQPVTFGAGALVQGERLLVGSSTYRGDFASVIQLMARGAYPTAGWVERVAMRDMVAVALPRLRAGAAVKLLVDPSE